MNVSDFNMNTASDFALHGASDRAARLISAFQLTKTELWTRFADQFKQECGR